MAFAHLGFYWWDSFLRLIVEDSKRSSFRLNIYIDNTVVAMLLKLMGEGQEINIPNIKYINYI
jgi:hypothetical protein